MTNTKVFIDGHAGTTGLRIFERLAARRDISLLTLPEELRKQTAARKEMLNQADIAILCLPDAAAVEAVALVENPAVKIIDASTAHRTAAGWAYGLPELSAAHQANICSSHRVAVPGCHASGFIALIYPLLQAGLLAKDSRLICHSLTGYSGGGKQMIASYDERPLPEHLQAPRLYGLGQSHKHLPEMQACTGLSQPPLFSPVVAEFYSGICVSVGLFAEDLCYGGIDDVRACYASCYQSKLLHYLDTPELDAEGMIAANALAGKDHMQIMVTGNEQRMLLTARYDNLGKGASGAALQCLNLLTNQPMELGLDYTI